MTIERMAQRSVMRFPTVINVTAANWLSLHSAAGETRGPMSPAKFREHAAEHLDWARTATTNRERETLSRWHALGWKLLLCGSGHLPLKAGALIIRRPGPAARRQTGPFFRVVTGHPPFLSKIRKLAVKPRALAG